MVNYSLALGLGGMATTLAAGLGGQWLPLQSHAWAEVDGWETARSEPCLTYLNAHDRLFSWGIRFEGLALKLNSRHEPDQVGGRLGSGGLGGPAAVSQCHAAKVLAIVSRSTTPAATAMTKS